MKVAVMEEYGGPEVLQWKEMPTPKPLAREVLVRVKAAPVNMASVKYRKGIVAAAHAKAGVKDVGLPHGVGVEVAGIVEAVGPGVTRFKPGDRVFGRNLNDLGGTPSAPGVERTPSVVAAPKTIATMGGVAEFALCAASELFMIPESLSFKEAAANVLGMQLAWNGLHTRGNLNKQDDVFVCPASGNTGFAAAQIAKLLGGRVIVAASTDEKVEHLRRLLHPHLALNYVETKDLEKAVKGATEGKGVEVCWDGNGMPTFDRTWRTVANGGRIMLFAGNLPGDATITFEIRLLNRRRVSIVPVTGVDDIRPANLKSFEQEVIPRLATRELGIPIWNEFPLTLEGLIAAENVFETRNYIGRVVLVNDDA